MSTSILLVLCAVVCLVSGSDKPSVTPTATLCTGGQCGHQLFLTSYLKNGSISEAQEAARVPPLAGSVESFSGFFTVDEEHGSNMFFWFFPSETGKESAPLVLWLNGGPAISSILDAFVQVGPYWFDEYSKITRKNLSWTKTMNVLYIDNPVGTGFSFTRVAAGYSANDDDVRRNLYSALYQFFQLFPQYQKNEFFIAGISYAGKYIPSLAYSIHENNPTASIKINLKGLVIGNGWLDPVNQLGYSEYLYNLGLIDLKTKGEFARVEDHIASLIEAQRLAEAHQELLTYIVGGRQISGNTLFTKATGMTKPVDYLYSLHYPSIWETTLRNVKQLFADPKFRKSFHVGNRTVNTDRIEADRRMGGEMVRSVAPWLEVLLDHYRVLLYNGQLDIICAYPLTMNYVYKLKWSGADEYRAAKRRLWYVEGGLAGYAKSGGNLTEVLVRSAGHTAAANEPEAVLDLVQKFLKNDPIGTQ